MRKPSSLLLAGAMAFGLTAASAAVTAFTIGTVEEVPGTDTATAVIAEGPCTGTYNVDFTQDAFGFTNGGTATRVAPEAPDTNLKFCASTPAYVELFDTDNPSTSTTWYGTTDADGDIAFSFANTLIAQDGWTVRITIGPEASF